MSPLHGPPGSLASKRQWQHNTRQAHNRKLPGRKMQFRNASGQALQACRLKPPNENKKCQDKRPFVNLVSSQYFFRDKCCEAAIQLLCFWFSFLLMRLGKQRKGLKCFDHRHPGGRCRCGFWLLTSAWPRLSHCSHLGRWPRGNISLSPFLSLLSGSL